MCLAKGCPFYGHQDQCDHAKEQAAAVASGWGHPQSGILFVRGQVPRELLMKAAHELGYLVRRYPGDKESVELIAQIRALLEVP